MAGTNAGFDANAFRSAIRLAMTMGAPTNPAEQVTFIWSERDTYAEADPGGNPYTWEGPGATPTSTTPQKTLTVPVAVQWGVGSLEGTAIGQFDSSRVTLTMLDEDYALVKGADSFEINGVHYGIDTIAPPIGLFDATVYQLIGTARG